MPTPNAGRVIQLDSKIFFDTFALCCYGDDRGSKFSFNICVASDTDVDWFMYIIAHAVQERGSEIPIFSYDADIGITDQRTTSAFLVTFLSGYTLTVGTAEYWCGISGNNWEQGEALYAMLNEYDMAEFRALLSRVGLPYTKYPMSVDIGKLDGNLTPGVHNLDGGVYAKILMDAPHNRGIDESLYGALRAHNWDDVYQYIHTNRRTPHGI